MVYDHVTVVSENSNDARTSQGEDGLKVIVYNTKRKFRTIVRCKVNIMHLADSFS